MLPPRSPSFNRSFIQNAKSMNVIFGESHHALFFFFFFFHAPTIELAFAISYAFFRLFFSSFLSLFLCFARRRIENNDRVSSYWIKEIGRGGFKIDRDCCNVILETLKTGSLRIYHVRVALCLRRDLFLN